MSPKVTQETQDRPYTHDEAAAVLGQLADTIAAQAARLDRVEAKLICLFAVFDSIARKARLDEAADALAKEVA